MNLTSEFVFLYSLGAFVYFFCAWMFLRVHSTPGETWGAILISAVTIWPLIVIFAMIGVVLNAIGSKVKGL